MSIKEYMVIAQDRVHVEHSTRQADDAWVLRETSDGSGSIELASIDCKFSIAEAYEPVEFG